MQKEKQKNIRRIKKAVGKIFNEHKNGSKSIELIISKIKPFLESDLVDEENIVSSLKKHSPVKEKKKFVKGVLSAVMPFFDLNKKEREKIKRKVFLKEGGFTPLNRVLSYGKHFYKNEEKKVIHIHLVPAKEFKKEIGEFVFLKLVEDGFRKLGKIVKKDKEVKEIAAISWIVAKRSELVENLGFTIEGEIEEEFRNEFFPYEPEEEKIVKAIISRKEFLQRYF